MNGFIEVTYNGDRLILNTRAVLAVEPCHYGKDADKGKNLGCKITTHFGGPNEHDTEIIVTDSYDDVKNKIVTAVSRS